MHKSRTGMCNDIIDNKDENMRNILEKSFVKSQMYEMHTPGQSSVSDVKRLIKSVIVSNKNNED